MYYKLLFMNLLCVILRIFSIETLTVLVEKTSIFINKYIKKTPTDVDDNMILPILEALQATIITETNGRKIIRDKTLVIELFQALLISWPDAMIAEYAIQFSNFLNSCASESNNIQNNNIILPVLAVLKKAFIIK